MFERLFWSIPISAIPLSYLLTNGNGKTDPIIGLITALAGLATAIVLFIRERKKK
jgi:hypothetical protein